MQYEPLEQWIWLPADAYPDRQTTAVSCMSGEDRAALGHYTVARFTREYRYSKPIQSVTLRCSGDTFFRLYVNDTYLCTGPAAVGGDFLGNDTPRPQYYATELTLPDATPGFSAGQLDFAAIVRMESIRLFEYSMGHGGFMLTAVVRFADGSKTILCTDERWMAQYLPAHDAPRHYSGERPSSPVPAKRIRNDWHCLTSPLPPSAETELIPEGGDLLVPAGGSASHVLRLPMIYTGYLSVTAETSGKVSVSAACTELQTGERLSKEEMIFLGDDHYLSTILCTAGYIWITAHNEDDTPAKLRIRFIASHYPTDTNARTTTSDSDLNQVLDVCTHTLKYCRQTLHLDSGSHCEPMACTGDYYIESLMTAMTFGDMRLAAFDTRRTAQLLRYNDGRMFHTTYSLIWVQMLWDVYQYTGETALLTDCEDALLILLERFAGYRGDNGLLETPPDYMFIDWLIPDDISTHHPPKALGQSCLNLFYYGALRTAAQIFDTIGESTMAAQCRDTADRLKKQIIALLYDPTRGLFFEGLNTPTPEHLLGKWMPKNVEKRYYRKHANILAAYFGVLPEEDCRSMLHRVMTDNTLGDIQPYFCHFLLDAVYRCGLRDTYTLSILEEWKAPVRECPYGLAEGFHKPEPTYTFDHSHAWGGTPSYALPLALSGLTMLAPAYAKIRLSPSLLGLRAAHTEIPTPYGMILIDQREGESPVVQIPKQIDAVIE